MPSENKLYLPTPIGELELVTSDNKLCALSIMSENTGLKNKEVKTKNSAEQNINEELLQQLQAYFFAATAFHELPLAPAGTPFEKAVWLALTKIPTGETRTYGAIASRLKSSPRAVGNACRKNPIAIIIPCHRVVSANGLGGYAGQTGGEQLSIKRWLLQHEGASV